MKKVVGIMITGFFAIFGAFALGAGIIETINEKKKEPKKIVKMNGKTYIEVQTKDNNEEPVAMGFLRGV